MKRSVPVFTALVFVLSVNGLSVAAPTPAASKKTGMMSQDDMMKGCRGHHDAMTKMMDDAGSMMSRAEASNDLSQMRKALADGQKKIEEMKKQMSMCMDMMNKMGGMHGGMMSGSGMSGMISGEKRTADKVKDPVCGMDVDAKTAPSATYEGKTYYFCSQADKGKFESNPGNYVKK